MSSSLRQCGVEVLDERRRAKPDEDLPGCGGGGENLGQVRVKEGGHVDRGQCLIPDVTEVPLCADSPSVQREGIRRSPLEGSNSRPDRQSISLDRGSMKVGVVKRRHRDLVPAFSAPAPPNTV